MKQQAKVYYQRISGSEKDKLNSLNLVDAPEEDSKWKNCQTASGQTNSFQAVPQLSRMEFHWK